MSLKSFYYKTFDRFVVPVVAAGIRVYQFFAYVFAFLRAVVIVMKAAPWGKIIPEIVVLLWTATLMVYVLIAEPCEAVFVVIICEIGMAIAIARLLSRANNGEFH